jgi:hypothetical protein
LALRFIQLQELTLRASTDLAEQSPLDGAMVAPIDQRALHAVVQALSVCLIGNAANVAHFIGLDGSLAAIVALLASSRHSGAGSTLQGWSPLGLHLWYNMYLTAAAADQQQRQSSASAEGSAVRLKTALLCAMVAAVDQCAHRQLSDLSTTTLHPALVPLLRITKSVLMTAASEQHAPFMLLWQACQDHVVHRWNLLEQGNGGCDTGLGLEFADIFASNVRPDDNNSEHINDSSSSNPSNPSNRSSRGGRSNRIRRTSDSALFVASIGKDIQHPLYSRGLASRFIPKASPTIRWTRDVPVCELLERLRELCSSLAGSTSSIGK